MDADGSGCAGTTIGFFGLLMAPLFVEPPTGSKEVVVAMVGALGTAWISAISYYFGSSSGRARQTEPLAQAPAIGGEGTTDAGNWWAKPSKTC